MARSFTFKDKTFSVGDTIDLLYRFVEGDKERKQKFTGILIKIRGSSDQDRMITIRKMSKSGIGVEKIVPIISPNIISISSVKKTTNTKAKVFYVRNLSQQAVKAKMYSSK